MSIDRLDYANIEVLCEVHDDEALARGSDRKFYGWLTFATGFVRQIGLDVEPSPSTDPRNLWHAEITVPDFDPDEFDSVTEYANALMSEYQWQPKPLSRRVREDIEQASEGLGK